MAYQRDEIVAEHMLPTVFHSGHIGTGIEQDVVRFVFCRRPPIVGSRT